MVTRSLLRAAAPLVGAAVLLCSALPSAAAGGPRWRIATATGRTVLGDVDANRPGDAWAAGFQCATPGVCGAPQVRVENYNGRAWHVLPTPRGLPAGSARVTVGGGSPTDGWLFVSNLSTVKALHWNGRRWAGRNLAMASVVSAVDVFGPRSVWIFGLADQKGYAARFNGRSWHTVPLPGAVYYQHAVSPRDIWAVGPTAATQAKPPAEQVFALMHWNGRVWRTTPLPKVRVRRQGYLAVYGLAVLGRRNLWLDYSTSGGARQGAALLHWNGAWHAVRVPYSASTFAVQRMAADGRGGLWIAALGGKGRFAEYLYHYNRGRWTRRTPPADSHMTVGLLDLSWIPGTSSAWAVGMANPTGRHGPEHGVILKYGN